MRSDSQRSRTIFFPSNTLIYGISHDGSKKFNIRTCEHMILGHLTMGAQKNKKMHPCGWVILAHSATFLLCWNFFMQIWFYQLNWMQSYIVRYLSNFAVTFHNFLVVTTQANMFRYLFDFPKTFYTFSVETMQAHIFRYLFNFAVTFSQIFGYVNSS